MNRLSRLFQPLSVAPKNAIIKSPDITSRSQKVCISISMNRERVVLRFSYQFAGSNLLSQLMLDIGLIRAAGNGTFHLLPMAHRSVEKCTRLVDRFMRQADAQKITMPLLTSADLWRKSGENPSTLFRILAIKTQLFARQIHSGNNHRTSNNPRSTRKTSNPRTGV